MNLNEQEKLDEQLYDPMMRLASQFMDGNISQVDYRATIDRLYQSARIDSDILAPHISVRIGPQPTLPYEKDTPLVALSSRLVQDIQAAQPELIDDYLALVSANKPIPDMHKD